MLQVDQSVMFRMSARKYLRIRVEIDTTKPLFDGFSLPRINKPPVKIIFKYKGLSEFCYACGNLGHVQQSYPIFLGNAVEPIFGQWMRADSQEPRRFNRIGEGVQEQPVPMQSVAPGFVVQERPPSLPPIRIREPNEQVSAFFNIIGSGKQSFF